MAFDSDYSRHSALVIVDMQNDFVREGAPLEVPDARGTIEAHQELIAAFRRRGAMIVYTKFLSMQEPCLLWNWSPQCKPPIKCCWKGHKRYYADVARELECTAVIDELTPASGEVVIEKFGYGAFHATPLNDILRNRGISTLLVTGTVTQICVEETAREAFHHGFRTTILADAVSSYAPDLHAATLKNFAMKFGWVAESRALLRQLA
ncbi:MAG: cysteine hydrolase [Bradyrhizobium sp.]|nr:cysteine hydrolase [Bradyrhizobium sp.]